MSELLNKESIQHIKDLTLNPHLNVRSLCLEIHDCKSIKDLAAVVVRGLGKLYDMSEIRWIEVGKTDHEILWASVYSAGGQTIEYDRLQDEFNSSLEINRLQNNITKYVEDDEDDMFVLTEQINQPSLQESNYYKKQMQQLGLAELVGLQIYFSGASAIILTMGREKEGFDSIDREDLLYIRNHVRSACANISRLGSCANFITALEETRKVNNQTGICVLSSDGSRLWEVDRTSDAIFSRTGAGLKVAGEWVLSEEVKNWTQSVMKNCRRVLPVKRPFTKTFGTNGNSVVAHVYLERAGRGGLLVFVTEMPEEQRSLREVGLEVFTRREREIATLMIANESSLEIAATLEISKRTVEKHFENIYTKLGAKNRLTAIKKLRATC